MEIPSEAQSLSVAPGNFKLSLKDFVRIKSTEPQEVKTTVDDAQVVSKSTNEDDEKFVRSTGQLTASLISEIISKVHRIRSEISLIKNQLTQPIHLACGNQGVLKLKLAEVENKLTSYKANKPKEEKASL